MPYITYAHKQTKKRFIPLNRPHTLGQKVKQLTDYPSCTGKSKAVPVLAKKAYKGSTGIAPLILNFGGIRGEWST
jgi:hypothetical protein